MVDEHVEQVIQKDGAQRKKGPQNFKERVYEKLRMPLWLLDTIIGLTVFVIVLLILLGRE